MVVLIHPRSGIVVEWEFLVLFPVQNPIPKLVLPIVQLIPNFLLVLSIATVFQVQGPGDIHRDDVIGVQALAL